MDEARTYPHAGLTEVETSTVLACAGCKREIGIRVRHFAIDSEHYHRGCEPTFAQDKGRNEQNVVHHVTIEETYEVTEKL